MNVVFDLGGVVFEWRPDMIASSVFADPDTQDLVNERIFRHPDWVSLDRGTLTLNEAVERGVERTKLSVPDVARLFGAVPASLLPKEATIDLIRRLGGTSNKLYVLSNMHVASIEYLEEAYDIWEQFEGIVISCRIQMVKPEAQIYQYLLGKFRLDPQQTIFIDDTSENVVAASELGIQTVKFIDSIQCERALNELGCL